MGCDLIQAVMQQASVVLLQVDAHDVWATQQTVDPFFKPPAAATRAPPTANISTNSQGDIDGSTRSAEEPAEQQHPLALREVAQQLQAGELLPADLPPMRVVRHEGRLYSLDNRRLWLFHQMAQPCIVQVQLVQPTKEFW